MSLSTFDLQTFDPASLRLVDTHCHIHDGEFAKRFGMGAAELIARAKEGGVAQMICIGTDLKSSHEAVEVARAHEACYATLALHPHEAEKRELDDLLADVATFEQLIQENPGVVVGLGECGLDYYYHESPEVFERQKQLLRAHIELALKYNLPLSFHIRDPKPNKIINKNNPRKPPEDLHAETQKGPSFLTKKAGDNRGDNRLKGRTFLRGEREEALEIGEMNEVGAAFADFFAIVDEYPGLRGVVHSFSAGLPELEGALQRGLYIGLNGIMTFTKNKEQLAAAKAVPLEKLLIETDAPFLTPAPFRGKMCEPKHVRVTAEFLVGLRGENLDEFAEVTTRNAQRLFGISLRRDNNK